MSLGLARRAFEWTEKEIETYPDPADAIASIPVTSGAAYAWGAWTEIIPVNTITSDFLLLASFCASYHSEDMYVQVGIGTTGVYTFVLPGDGEPRAVYFIPHIRVPANSQIQLRMASSGVARTINYHVLQYVELPM